MKFFNLPTRGMDAFSQFNILQRHVFAFVKHLTIKKLINLFKSEYNSITKKVQITSYPYILKIESSNICNLKCAYCYDDRRPPVEGERHFGKMSFDDFGKLIDEVGPYLFKMNLYGFGEPFLFSESFDMIKYATEKNIGVGVSSNLNIEDPSLAEKIVRSGLETLIFSCHGVKEESYNKFMGNGNMELAMRNIKSIVKKREEFGTKIPFIDWQFCVTRFNQNELDMARSLAKEIGIDQIRFIKPFIPEDAAEEWKSDFFPKNESHSEHKNPSRCSWIYRSAYINYDGNLLPCCRDVRLMSNDFGNVFMNGFSSVWNNEKYKISRRLIAHPKDNNVKCDTICSRCPVTFRTEK